LPCPRRRAHRAFDSGLRRGIDAMFSDFKTRGFGLEDSHIRIPLRLDPLILALYWAVSTGMWDTANRQLPPKKRPASKATTLRQGDPSLFRRSIRRSQNCLHRLSDLPPLSSAWAN
jgi:hypothetical protein